MEFNISMMTPECEQEAELAYQICLKCDDREGCEYGEVIIEFWESHRVKKFHRKLKEDGVLDTRGRE